MSTKLSLTCTGLLCILILSQCVLVVQCSCENIPVCHWNSWHEWSSCNATCGSGMQSRWRGPCCDPSNANSYMGCINFCNLSLSAGKDYQSCTACLTSPSTGKTTKSTTSTLSTMLSTILQQTTTMKPVPTTSKSTAATTTKTPVIASTHSQTKAIPKTTPKPKTTTSNVNSLSSTIERKTMTLTTPPAAESDITTTSASVSASKAVLSGAAIAGIILGSLGLAVTVLVLVFKYSKLMKQNKVMSASENVKSYRSNGTKRIHVTKMR